jgi:hypothetical protein
MPAGLELKATLVEPTYEEEVASLGDDDVFDMVNLTSDDTGIEGVIFISTAVGQHGPRVKYYLKRSKDQPSFSVSIASEPRILASSLPDRTVRRVAPQVLSWVKKNRDDLLAFWSEGAYWPARDVEQFLQRLRSRKAD